MGPIYRVGTRKERPLKISQTFDQEEEAFDDGTASTIEGLFDDPESPDWRSSHTEGNEEYGLFGSDLFVFDLDEEMTLG